MLTGQMLDPMLLLTRLPTPLLRTVSNPCLRVKAPRKTMGLVGSTAAPALTWRGHVLLQELLAALLLLPMLPTRPRRSSASGLPSPRPMSPPTSEVSSPALLCSCLHVHLHPTLTEECTRREGSCGRLVPQDR